MLALLGILEHPLERMGIIYKSYRHLPKEVSMSENHGATYNFCEL